MSHFGPISCPDGYETVIVTGSRSGFEDHYGSGSVEGIGGAQDAGQPGSADPTPSPPTEEPQFLAPPPILPPPPVLAPPLIEVITVTAPRLLPGGFIVGGLFAGLEAGFEQAQARLRDYFFEPVPIPEPVLAPPEFVPLDLPPELPTVTVTAPLPEVLVRPGTATPLRDPRDFPFDPLPAIGFPFFDPVPQVAAPALAPAAPEPAPMPIAFYDPGLIFGQPGVGFAPFFPPAPPQIAPPLPQIPAPPGSFPDPRPPAVRPAPPEFLPTAPDFFAPLPQLPGFSVPGIGSLTGSYPADLTYPFNDPSRFAPTRPARREQDQCEEELRNPCEVGFYASDARGRVSFQIWGTRTKGCKPNASNSSRSQRRRRR